MAWALVVFLSLASAVLFLRYVGIDGQLANPKMVQALRQIMAFAHPSPSTAAPAAATVPVMRQQAEFSLYMSIATGLLATLTFIVLAATHQRRPLRRQRGDLVQLSRRRRPALDPEL